MFCYLNNRSLYNWLTVTSFTAVQTQIEQNCPIHAYTTVIGVVVSAQILRARVERKTPVLVTLSDTGTNWYQYPTLVSVPVRSCSSSLQNRTHHTRTVKLLRLFNSADLVCRCCVGASR